MSRSGSSGWGSGKQNNDQYYEEPGHGPRNQNNGFGGGGTVHDGGGIVLRLVLNLEEVHYLFGSDEVLLQQLKQQTGANIVLSDPGAHERVLTITSNLDITHKAFTLICRKLWELVSNRSAEQQQHGSNASVLVLRLAVHASQCGSIIGKQGVKIKEIRDLTGANINVAPESLPESNERSIEVIGTGESCLQTVYHICCVLQESPPKGEVIPYVPQSLFKDVWKPLILANNKAYVIENGLAVLAPPPVLKAALAETPLGPMVAAIPNSDTHHGPEFMNPLALMSAISKAQREKITGATGPEIYKEMRIDNEVAGSVIGRGGSKVGEIRKISGASVNINTEDEVTEAGERIVIIKGSPESVLLAQFLVHSNIELYKKDRHMDRGPSESDLMDVGPYRSFAPHMAGGRGGAHRGGGGQLPVFGRGGRRSSMEGNRRGGGPPVGHQMNRGNKGRRR